VKSLDGVGARASGACAFAVSNAGQSLSTGEPDTLQRPGGRPQSGMMGETRADMFKNICEDLRAYNGRWDAQGFWVMIVYRFGRWRYGVRLVCVRKFFSLVYHVLFKISQVVTGIELPCEVEVGHNFVIDHFGGIVVSGYAKFGNNCRIRSGVVIGLRHIGDERAPTIGNNVDIGSGAKILGPIRIGDNVLIGANAVVLVDVPDDCIAVGVPAVVRPREKNGRGVEMRSEREVKSM
jgi:serine O-acetyltransferase